PAHHLLPLEAQSLRFGLSGERGELFDVRPGDEAVGLPRGQHHRADLGLVADADEQRFELDLHRGVELVDRLAGQVEGHDRDPVAHLGGEGRHRYSSRSSTRAYPIPPWAQIEISPNCTSRRFISLASVVISRHPVAANGCPMAIEPPITLVMPQSTSPTGPDSPSRSA